MKILIKVIFTFCFLLQAIISFANPVDENTAKTVGLNFINSKILSNKTISSQNIILAYKATELGTNSKFITSYYVFNLTTSKGFVMVSANDIIKPILGYSTESNFDTSNKQHIPIQFTQWVANYSKAIAYAVQKNLPASPSTTLLWQQLKTGSIKHTMSLLGTTNPVVQPLLSTNWDQISEIQGSINTYNAHCPYDKVQGVYTLTGCVATAMAQVMKYWNYPAKGTGSHSYTPATYSYLGSLTANFGNTTFQWDSMPNSLSPTSTPAQINAVATLMYDCGVSVNMDYGAEGSGAYEISYNGLYSNTAQSALVNNFSYNNSLQGLQRSNYSDSIWLSLIKNELDVNRPVIYGGSGNQGGHCFVADGYDINDNLHFNWGWSGYFNGYFSINNLSPGGDTFNVAQDAIIGIKPKVSYAANTSDSLILVALYDSLGGTKWTNNGGWLKGAVNSWYGIVLNTSGRVVSIELSGNNLSGNIPPSLKNLTKLTNLDLSRNNFTNSIPSALLTLSSLNTLDLSSNQFTGAIPNVTLSGLPSLYTMDLSNNKLTGTIPTSFNNLPKLYTLDLSNNQLSGTLPSLISDTNYLSIINLSGNNFSGTIPSIFLSSIKYVNELDLSNNKFSGTIPAQVYAFPYLFTLDLSGNQLTGSISTSLQNLNQLTVLSLAGNQLTGTIPSGISYLNQLINLDLSNNQLSGSIPNSFNTLTLLTNLDISNNSFSFSGMNYITKMNWLYSNIYYPQALVKLDKSATLLSVTVGGTLSNNTYKWYNDASLVYTKKGDSTFVPSAFGSYHLAATNSLAPKLTLYSDTLTFSLLPLTWVSFEAKEIAGTVLLTWQTATELNTNQFIIEHSIDGINFSTIGTVDAIGNGNNAYSFKDLVPIAGVNYYRIMSLDNTRNILYSNTLTATIASTSLWFTIYPNPAKAITNLNFGNSIKVEAIVVYDITGKPVIQNTINETNSIIQLNTSQLLEGVYIIAAKTSKGWVKEKLIIK